MEKMVVTVSNQNKNQNHNQNQNFRRNNTPPNRQRDSDQQVIPPFQEKFLHEDEGVIEEPEGNTMNMLGIEKSIQGEHFSFGPFWSNLSGATPFHPGA